MPGTNGHPCSGVSHPVDAASILQAPNKRTFSFLTLTAGLLSNLDYGTNHLRWMGELRFTLGAICKFP